MFLAYECPLGSGQFGAVFKAKIKMFDRTTTIVALKMAKPNCPKEAFKSLLSEIKILIYLGKHENIVSILGAYTVELHKGIVYIATELCNLGSLKSFLINGPPTRNTNEYENTIELVNKKIICEQFIKS